MLLWEDDPFDAMTRSSPELTERFYERYKFYQLFRQFFTHDPMPKRLVSKAPLHLVK